MMHVTDRLLSDSRVTAADAITALDRVVGGLGAHDHEFAPALATACNQAGVDFAIAYSHCANETNFFRDDNWDVRLNPAGIGIDGTPGHLGPTFPSATAAARFYVALLLLKIRQGADVGVFENERATAPTFFDGTRNFAFDPTFPTVSILDDLRLRFGINNRECVWMCDKGGPIAIVQKATALFPSLPNQGGPDVERTMRRNLSYILVDAGHRETGPGGNDANPAERGLTHLLAEEYVRALRGAGYRADWYQRDIDGDALATETLGSLTDVALGANRHLRQQAGANILFLSCHYNGAHSPFHVIYPDERGLTTAIQGGAPGFDTEANNPLDTELARVMATEYDKIPDVTLMQGAGIFTGTMSETRTGVGEDGFRLALFAATVPVRDRCVRLVIEHGGTEDPAAQRQTFTQECAAALLRALPIVYGPVVSFPQQRIPITAAGLLDFGDAPDVTVEIQNPDKFECIHGTSMRTYPDRDAPRGAKRPARRGKPYRFGFTATVNGEKWLASRAGSWAVAANFKERD